MARFEAEYTLGIGGGGQLGLMTHQANLELGNSTIVLDPNGADCPAAKVGGAAWIKGGLRDREAIFELVRQSNYVTIEIEHLDGQALKDAAKHYGRGLHPNARSITLIQNKFLQHQALANLGIPVAPHWLVTDYDELAAHLDSAPAGLVLKNARDAFDGRGNFKLNKRSDISAGVAHLTQGDRSKQLYAEQVIPFEREVAMMMAIGKGGQVVTYPLMETRHLRGQLREVLAPAPVYEQIKTQADQLARMVGTRFLKGGWGLYGVEMFLSQDGQLLVNELAPRPHNSGHLTIEACQTSQFTNHVHAVMGQRLGDTSMIYEYAAMFNVIGDLTGLDEASKIPNSYTHLYGKAERSERKLGHLTIVGDDYEEFIHGCDQARHLLVA